MASKIVLGTSGVLALAACGITAYTATTPDWFHATYPDQDCPVGQVGLFTSNWDPENCAGLKPDGSPRLTGPSSDLDTAEFWPLFPLQYPNITGNPLQPIYQEFVDCETAVDAVFDYVLVVLAEAGLKDLLEGFAGVGYTPSTPEANLRFAFNAALTPTLNLTEPALSVYLDAAWAQAYPYVQNCAASGTEAATNSLVCLTYLQTAGALGNLGTAFNTDAPADKAAAVALCEDDLVDYSNLELGQKLIPAGAALGGLAAVLAIVAAVAAPPAAIGAAVFALGDSAMMMGTLLVLGGTPAAAGVGKPCEGESTCYTQETNALLGLVVVILGVLSAVLCIVGFVLHKRESTGNQLV